jgi:Ca2+-binding EF-hand superfamily protein
MWKTYELSLFAVVLAAGAVSGLAQGPATAPVRPKKAVDHVRGLIDLYFQGQERDRFFAAAGVDGELTKEEFDAAAGQPGSFVRPYDGWAAAIVFDADHNQQLNWVEAEQYRLAVRAKVMRMFDKDKDGRLTGAERDAANAYLGAGMGRPGLSGTAPPTHAVAPPPLPPDLFAQPEPNAPRTDPAWRNRWEQLQARYDADKDGQLSDAEQEMLHEGLRASFRKRLLQQFDKNRDGALDEAEQRAVEEQQRLEEAEWRRQWERMQWDRNKDGQLDRDEQAAMEKHLAEQRQLAQQRRLEWIKRWDKDGDGKLSNEERAEVTKDLRQRVTLQRKQMDTNGDGKITAEEIRAYRKKLFEEP